MEDERANDLPIQQEPTEQELIQQEPIQQEPAEPTAVDAEQAATPNATPDSGAIEPASAPSAVSAGIPRFIHLILDVALGFCILMVVGIFALVFHRFASNLALPFAVGLFFVVALTRAIWSKLNPWVEGIAISLGAFIPVSLVAVVFHSGILLLFGLGLALALICGAAAQTQRFLRRRQWVNGAATVAALVLVLIAGKYALPRLAFSPGMRTMNQPAPRFTVTMLDGTLVRLDSLKGRVVVLDFWGTWCGPCMAEMPTVQKVHRAFAANRDVVFLAVNAGWEDDTGDKVRAFTERKHLDVPVAMDTNRAVRDFSIDALPTLVVIDRQGHIRMEETGYDQDEPLESELTGRIQSLLKE